MDRLTWTDDRLDILVAATVCATFDEPFFPLVSGLVAPTATPVFGLIIAYVGAKNVPRGYAKLQVSTDSAARRVAMMITGRKDHELGADRFNKAPGASIVATVMWRQNYVGCDRYHVRVFNHHQFCIFACIIGIT